MTSPTSRGLSLSPGDMLSESDILLQLSCEQVVDRLLKIESNRNEHTMPDSETEVRVPYRNTLRDVRAGIKSLADIENRGEWLVVKCLSHKGICLLDQVEGIKTLNEQASDISRLVTRYGGISAIGEMADDVSYRPIGREGGGRGEFRMAKRLKSAYAKYVCGLGMDLSSLVAVALGWVLSITNEPDLLGIADDLKLEVEAFNKHVRDRAILMDAYWRIAQEHLKDMGKV